MAKKVKLSLAPKWSIYRYTYFYFKPNREPRRLCWNHKRAERPFSTSDLPRCVAERRACAEEKRSIQVYTHAGGRETRKGSERAILIGASTGGIVDLVRLFWRCRVAQRGAGRGAGRRGLEE